MGQGILHVRSLDMCWHSSSAEHPILDFTHGFDQGDKFLFGGKGGHKNGLWCYSVNGYYL